MPYRRPYCEIWNSLRGLKTYRENTWIKIKCLVSQQHHVECLACRKQLLTVLCVSGPSVASATPPCDVMHNKNNPTLVRKSVGKQRLFFVFVLSCIFFFKYSLLTWSNKQKTRLGTYYGNSCTLLYICELFINFIEQGSAVRLKILSCSVTCQGVSPRYLNTQKLHVQFFNSPF